MASDVYQDPWVKEHRRMYAEDQEYVRYVKKHKREVNRIVRRYMLKSSFKEIGLMIVMVGMILGVTHLVYVYLASGADVIGHLLGEYGLDQQILAALKVFGLAILMPILLAVGSFLIFSGLKSERKMKKLDFATRMVEGYRQGVDPAKMRRPKRY